MLIRRLSLLCLTFGLIIWAADKPNFTGTWKLNTSKSDFGPAPGPDSLTREVKHDDPNIQIKTTQSGPQGSAVTEAKWTTDGKESVNSTPRGEVKGSMKWDGDTLVHQYKVNTTQAGEIAIEDRWKLAEEGKVMDVKSKISGGFGEFERKMVLEKQ